MSAADDTEDVGGLDRRSAVPACRELFVTAEAEAGECTYRLLVTFGVIKIVLSRAEIASQVQKIRRGWEARVAMLQREPAQREQFEEHVRAVLEERRSRKRDHHRGMNFLDRNARQVSEASPRRRLLKLQKQALRGFARHDAVNHAREEIEEEEEHRKVSWLNKSEQRRVLRAEELQRQEMEQRQQDLQRQWLTKMAMLAFAEKTARTFTELRDAHEFIQKQICSAGVIHKYFVRSLCRKRRSELYRNVIKLRVALIAYTRMVRPAVMSASQPVIRGFLDVYAFHRESPTLSGALNRFRARVVLIQKWWAQLKLIRKAYVCLFLPFWIEIQMRVYKEWSHEIASQEHAAMQAENDIRKTLAAGRVSDMEKASRLSRRNLTKGPSVLRTNTRGSFDSEADLSVPARQATIEQNMDQLPVREVKPLLTAYICKMQRSHKQRVKDWEENRQAAQWAKDLEGFGVHEDAPKGAKPGALSSTKPRVVYKDFTELEALVRQHMERWKKAEGDFKHVKAGRRNIMKQPFRAWVRSMKCVWLQVGDDEEEEGAKEEGAKGSQAFLTAAPEDEEASEEEAEGGESAEESADAEAEEEEEEA